MDEAAQALSAFLDSKAMAQGTIPPATFVHAYSNVEIRA